MGRQWYYKPHRGCSIHSTCTNWPVAQWQQQMTVNHQVGGSIPSWSAMKINIRKEYEKYLKTCLEPLSYFKWYQLNFGDNKSKQLKT